jgi:hypothetical protein
VARVPEYQLRQGLSATGMSRKMYAFRIEPFLTVIRESIPEFVDFDSAVVAVEHQLIIRQFDAVRLRHGWLEAAQIGENVQDAGQ